MQKLKSFTFVILFGIAAVGMTTSAAHAAVIWTLTDGQLVRAQNIVMGGVLFDVEFFDDSCETVFDGCDATADFDFITATAAEAAAQALLDQVFINLFGPLPATLFDTNPALTDGCSTTQCVTLIPYGVPSPGSSFSFASAFNDDSEANDSTTSGGTFITTASLVPSLNANFAVFTRRLPGQLPSLPGGEIFDPRVSGPGPFPGTIFLTVPVPEPSTLLLFGVGLAGLAFARRKKAA